MNNNSKSQNTSLGIVRFDAFGQLAALHLAQYFEIMAYDPSLDAAKVAKQLEVRLSSLHSVSQADVILIAAPVSSFEQVVSEIAVVCKPGTLVIDVGSVKVVPSEIMRRRLPDHVDIVASHPCSVLRVPRQVLRVEKLPSAPFREDDIQGWLRFYARLWD
ncbi:Prephenate dehydrogenase [Pseudovibrio ascidiaceicola]|uniref:Prephenate dehydrogenase n=1 Tax=Pseudovibrio ascidiaceicola TaxID=285279 RepID=A0A1I4G1L2_9HYPH|nr:prephenate dehydrogenase/arogenate dehydrogenase family protein [Pseudovibrio ascidiaceicola]SFL22966.1 Prephenate dehydrogenase [Pseudovibrio ascidiaceicola]